MARLWSYPTPLTEATLVRRYKRFLADVRLTDGRELTVHCANPGSMRGVAEPGQRVRIRDSGNPKRKLPWSLEQVRAGRTWVMVNTAWPNAIVALALAEGRVPGADPSRTWLPEVPDGEGSRFDFCAEPNDSQARHWIEVKNVTWRVGSQARFPDAVTARGLRHMQGLADRVRAGDQATLVFCVSRADVGSCAPAWDLDPAYAEGLARAAAAGVTVVALRLQVTKLGLDVRDVLPVELRPPSV